MDVALVLDVDGVLIDPTRGGLGPWQSETARRFGIEPATIQQFFASGWREVIDGRSLVLDALKTYLGTAAPDVDPSEFLAHWLETDAVLNDSVVQVAKRWAGDGVPVFLGTNQEHQRAAFLRGRLAEHFELRDVLYSADLGAAKPTALYFERATARVGAERIVFVDDAKSNVEAANGFGWKAIQYTGQATFAEELEALLWSD